MNKNIAVTLTQEEANATFLALINKLDFYDEEIKKAGKRGTAEHIIRLAQSKDLIKNVVDKLSDAGALLPFDI